LDLSAINSASRYEVNGDVEVQRIIPKSGGNDSPELDRRPAGLLLAAEGEPVSRIPFSRRQHITVESHRAIVDDKKQFTRLETYLNSKAIETIGLDKRTDPWIARDASGHATGIVDNAGAAAVRNAAGFLKEVPKEVFEKSQMTMMRDLAMAGLTASGGSCDFEDIYKGRARASVALYRARSLTSAESSGARARSTH
jgi:hypothetical protein